MVLPQITIDLVEAYTTLAPWHSSLGHSRLRGLRVQLLQISGGKDMFTLNLQ